MDDAVHAAQTDEEPGERHLRVIGSSETSAKNSTGISNRYMKLSATAATGFK
jgi:hypothetical protein